MTEDGWPVKIRANSVKVNRLFRRCFTYENIGKIADAETQCVAGGCNASYGRKMKKEEYIRQVDLAFESLSGQDLEERLLKLCDASRQEYGAGDAVYASMLSEMGAYYRGQKETVKAEQYFLEALRILEKAGAALADIATVMNNLAGVYRMTERYGEAEQLYKSCLEIYKKELGNRHILFAAGLNNLGGLYSSMNRSEEALELFKRALDILRDYPDALDELAASLCNLGNLYIQKKLYAEAEKNLLEAKRIYETQVDYCTPHYYITLNSLGLSKLGLGDQEEAARMFRAAAEACEKIYGKGHEDYKMIIRHLQATEGEKM